MISPNIILALIAIVFIGGIAIVFYMKEQKTILTIPIYSSLIVSILSGMWALRFFQEGAFLFCRENLVIDPLAIFHLLLVNLLFTATSFYMIDYFGNHEADDKAIAYFRRYTALWQAFHAMLLVVLISNNIGLTWIALESSTLVSSFLILSESESLSIEAMWKYLLICSIGIALAFIGTVLVISAARTLPTDDSVYTFTELQNHVSSLNPSLMLFAFIFIVVGYGTKAGLAPMHTWLPDAHSQAPTPVSAVFSGVMLNCALFAIMRYMPIIDAATGNSGHVHMILLFFGFSSLLVAAVFIPIQYDLKRLLAYCSIEHIGIIAIGLGLGGFGIVVALLHTLNHSLSKMLAFFSAGAMINHYKTRDLRKITAALKTMPIWGTSFLLSMLVLLGVAPSSVFLSEFLLAKTAFSNERYLIFTFFLLGTLAIFISLLRPVLNIAFGKTDPDITVNNKISLWNIITIGVCCVEFIVFGLWLPEPFMNFLKSAALIIEHGLKL